MNTAKGHGKLHKRARVDGAMTIQNASDVARHRAIDKQTKERVEGLNELNNA